MNQKRRLILLFNGVSATVADGDDSPSFSLMAISAYLKSLGYECRLLLNRLSDDQLKALASQSLAAGFSVYTGTGIVHSMRMTARLKRICPELPVIWGGYHPTLEPEQTLRYPDVDFVVRGEGEKTIAELLQVIENGPSTVSLASINGLSYRQDGRFVHNQTRHASDVADYPRLDYELYDELFRGESTIPYIASRGCPFDCRFCCSAAINRVHGKRFMHLPVSKVMQDLQWIVERYNPRKIDFLDDNFLVSEKRVLEFASQYRAHNFQFQWTAFGRCDVFSRLNEDVIRQLRSVNLVKIYFGVESGSPRMLDLMRKRMKPEQAKRAVAAVAQHGISVDCTFMNGFPTESWQDVQESLRLRRWIKNVCPDATVRFFVFTPLPGTELFDDCLQHGLRRPESLEDWVGYEYHSFQAPWFRRQYRNRLNTISWASFFDTLEVSTKMPWHKELVLRLVRADGRFRLQTRFLTLAPEFLLLNEWFTRRSRSHAKDLTQPGQGQGSAASA